VALLGIACRDVDLGTLLDEPCRDHLSDAARPAGDESRSTFERKQILVHGELDLVAGCDRVRDELGSSTAKAWVKSMPMAA
jgi:hypothetical protein